MDLIFKGNERVLHTVNNGDPLVESLAIPSEACSLIGTDIKLGEEVGRGNFGKVYVIQVPGKGEKKYVVKKGTVRVFEAFMPLKSLTKRGLSKEMVMAFNPHANPDENIRQKLIGPTFANSCIVPKGQAKVYERIPHSVKTVDVQINGPAYICKNNTYSEFFIGAMVGEAYRKGECANFFDVYSMFTCKSKKKNTYHQYIVMDKIDGEWGNNASCQRADTYIKHVPDNHIHDVQRGVFIQLMFAIAFYQHRYQLSHNDLHSKNIFIEYVTDKNEFNGEKYIDAEWYHYHLTGKGNQQARDVYIPAIPVILKIGDFGLSVKHSEPVVGDKMVFTTGYDQDDGHGPWIPNVFMPSYDSLYSANAYNLAIHKDVKKDKRDTLLDSMLSYLAGVQSRDEWYGDNASSPIDPDNHRPWLDYLEKNKLPTAEDLLRSDLVQEHYGYLPGSGNIITLGVL